MEQDRSAVDAAVAKEWDEGKDKVEDEWEDRLPQDQAEIVSAQSAVIKSRILSDNRAMQKRARSAACK